MGLLYWQIYNLEKGKAKEFREQIDSVWDLGDKNTTKYPEHIAPMNILGKWYGPGYRRASVFDFRDFNHFQKLMEIMRNEEEIREFNKKTNAYIDEITWSAEFWGEIIPDELIGKEQYSDENDLWYIQKWIVEKGKTVEATETLKKFLRFADQWIKDNQEYANIKARFFWQWYKGNRLFYIIKAKDMDQLTAATKIANEDEEFVKLNKELTDLLHEHSWKAELWQKYKRPKEEEEK